MNFNFIATDNFNLKNLNDIDAFVDAYPDFQTVVLATENELKLLLEFIGVFEFSSEELNGTDFSKYWNLSKFKFPEFNDHQFDQFYENWIQKSNRDNNMDEYGNLIFLRGMSSKWNRLKNRLIVKEND